jgi:ketosteroid isomerase-like protein
MSSLRTTIVRGAAAMIAAVFALGAPWASASENDATAVLAADAQFYAALNEMFKGEVAPIESIWSHSSDVDYMGPDGRVVRGWTAVRDAWRGQAALRLGGRVESSEVQSFIGRDIAVIDDYEKGENAGANGKVQQVNIRATNIYRKEDGQWKMVGHHVDLLPYLVK